MNANLAARRAAGGAHDNPFPVPQTAGWRPTCACEPGEPPVPCVVYDPFMGAGTTGLVALVEGRCFVGSNGLVGLLLESALALGLGLFPRNRSPKVVA